MIVSSLLQDPGISNAQPSGSYPPYDEGLTNDIFIKNPNGSGPVVGVVRVKFELTDFSSYYVIMEVDQLVVFNLSNSNLQTFLLIYNAIIEAGQLVFLISLDVQFDLFVLLTFVSSLPAGNIIFILVPPDRKKNGFYCECNQNTAIQFS